MKITYLAHSGFLVETSLHTFVFDFVQGDLRTALGDKEAVFFVSHAHDDHFKHRIFSFPHKEIVVSKEVPLLKWENAKPVSPGDILKVDGCTVHVFGSTDLGVSFLVEADGETLFHAGDFNFWHWKEVSTLQEVKEMETLFYEVLTPMLPFAGKIDVCFFPVDPRLGTDCGEGAQLFIQKMQPRALVPMHFLGREEEAKHYAQKLQALLPVHILTESMDTATI